MKEVNHATAAKGPGTMGKRFTDTDKWTKNKWFRKLPNENKLFWLFMLDHCDAIGVWEEDIEFANMMIGYKYTTESVLDFLGDRIKIINSGKKWWIRDFCRFQYGILDPEKTTNRPHQSYIMQLRANSLWIDYLKTINSHKEKDKEKEKDQDKEKDGNLELILNGQYSKKFEDFWQKQIRKVGKGDAWSVWKKKKLDGAAEVIIAAWEKQKPIYQKRAEKPDYDPPHPRTWLSQCRWQDELEDTKPQRTYL